MPKFLIYMVVNTLNGKYYIGAHTCRASGNCHRATKGKRCTYMGSGKALKAAIRKHGSRYFVRYVLSTVDTEERMYALEAELVNVAFVSDPKTYNSVVGGRDGVFRTPGVSEAVNKSSHTWERTEEYRRRSSEAQIRRFEDPAARQKISRAMKGRYVSPVTRWKHSLSNMGRPVSLETRIKMSLAKRGKFNGDKNPNYRHGKGGPPKRTPLYRRFDSPEL